MRKPVGIAAFDDDNGVTISHVVCDDGAVFSRFSNDSRWVEDTPIPGTERDDAPVITYHDFMIIDDALGVHAESARETLYRIRMRVMGDSE